MKVMQTLGRHAGAQEGVFQYRRTAQGVEIDSTVGQATLTPISITLTHAEWTSILSAIGTATANTFRLTGSAPFTSPPNQSLYEAIQSAVPTPSGGWNWNDSWKAYICAIMEHEGSVDLYHGTLGHGHSHPIVVRRDF
jgi:hypothetical protein